MKNRVVPQAEKDFLTNIKRRLGRMNAEETPIQPVRGAPDYYCDLKMDEQEMVASFVDALRAVEGEAYVIASQGALEERFLSVLQRFEAKRVIRSSQLFLEKLGLDEMIQKAGAALDVWSPARSPEANIAAAAQADIGITGADFAVANTGTLALFSGSEQGRSISLLPLTHIAIFHKSALVPRLGLVLNRVKEMEAQGLEPSSLNFITGPSRSSDIEGQSVRGVHGPGNVIAMILDFDT